MIKEQLFRACRGERGHVEELQTSTGVKDQIAQFWIEAVLSRAQAEQKKRISDKETRDARLNDRSIKNDARKVVVEGLKVEIQKDVFAWLVRQPPRSLDTLPAGSRRHFLT